MASSWDERYRVQTETDPPSAFLLSHLPIMPRGRALDVAMGQGRHAFLLAEQGFAVTGVDRSAVALEQVDARVGGLSIQPVLLDLEREPLPAGPYHLVLVTRYLQRSLFPDLVRVLAPGGMLLYETYTTDRQKAMNPDFLLRPGELATAFPTLHTVDYREKDGLASLLASKAE